jgi:hypothetical protein
VITIVKAIQTGPTQWDAWGRDGRFLYLHYRRGRGVVYLYPGEVREGEPEVVGFFERPACDAVIELEQLCEQTGITLAPNVIVEGIGGRV